MTGALFLCFAFGLVFFFAGQQDLKDGIGKESVNRAFIFIGALLFSFFILSII